MTDARARRLDAVCVWKFDRFARSLKNLVDSLAEFEALGVAFVSLHDGVDLSTPQGKLMFHIVAAMAEFERSLIQQRVRGGIANARAKGKQLRRPRAVIDADRGLTLRAAGVSWAGIGKALGQKPVGMRKVHQRALQ